MEENSDDVKKKALICLILWPILTVIIFLIVMNLGLLDVGWKKTSAAMPVFTAQLTEDGKKVVIKTDKPKGGILYYTIDGSDPTEQSAKYESEFIVDHNVSLKCLFVDEKGSHSQIETNSIVTEGNSESNGSTSATNEIAVTNDKKLAQTGVVAKNSDDLLYDIEGIWQRTNENGGQVTYMFRRTATDQGQMECIMIMPKGNGDGYSASISTSLNSSGLLQVVISQVVEGGTGPTNKILQIQCEPYGDNQIIIDGRAYDYIGKWL